MREIPLSPEWIAGAVSFEPTGGGLKPWRLPAGQLGLFDEKLIEKAEMAAGVRVQATTEASAIELVVAPDRQERPFDLAVGGQLVRAARLPAGQEVMRFDVLPAGRKSVEIWLSHVHPVVLKAVRIDAGSAAALDDKRPRWVTYGSSITHCADSYSPARTWPALVARRHGLHLTCLGYGGCAHLEPLVGMMIRDLSADWISLKLGINTHADSLNCRTFKWAAVGLVRIIREKQPAVPITLISPVISLPRETGQVGRPDWTLVHLREELADAARRLQAAGDPNLVYVDGLKLFGPDLAAGGYMPDDLHPNAAGYEHLAENFSRHVVKRHLPGHLSSLQSRGGGVR